MKINCEVYRCSNKANTYLYLKTGVGLESLPDSLLSLLGELSCFLRLELGKSSKLAQANVSEVLAALVDHDYYLQMPPAESLKAQIPESGFVQ